MAGNRGGTKGPTTSRVAMAKRKAPSSSHVGRKLLVRDGNREREAVLVSLRRGGGAARGWVQAEGQAEQKSILLDETKVDWLHPKGESERGA